MEDAIGKLFQGHISTFYDCIEVDYKSTHKHSFVDLQLYVKGQKDILDSFDDYTEVDMLDGQNQHMAGGFGLQVRMVDVNLHLGLSAR